MKVLLDTHFLIWLMNEPTELRPREREAIDQAESIHLSAVSLWELRTKWRIFDRHGRRKGTVDPVVAVTYAERYGFPIEPLTARDAVLELNPPIENRDPFDEILLVHAQRIGARLLTRDDKLIGHPLALHP